MSKSLIHTSVQKINKIIRRVDEVFLCVLKECQNRINVALTNIFNKSIASGDVPCLWRVMSNYCQISLSIIGKMLESIISKKVQQHLVLHESIADSQHGFTKGESCLTNLFIFV